MLTNLLDACRVAAFSDTSDATASWYRDEESFAAFDGVDLLPEMRNYYPLHSPFRALNDPTIILPLKMWTCVEMEQNDTTLVRTVGPFNSTGGFDWWKVYWYDRFFESVQNEGPWFFKSNSIGLVDARGTRIGNPPLHIHHSHTDLGSGSFPPRKTLSDCLLDGYCTERGDTLLPGREIFGGWSSDFVVNDIRPGMAEPLL